MLYFTSRPLIRLPPFAIVIGSCSTLNDSRHLHHQILHSCSETRGRYSGFSAVSKGRTFSRDSGPNFTISRVSEMTTLTKPPNIVIYDDGGSTEVERLLKTCADPDKYVFLYMNSEQLRTDPWQDNVELMVVRGSNISVDDQPVLLKYWRNGGKILSICSDFVEHLDDNVKLFRRSLSVDNHMQRISHKLYGEVQLPLSSLVPTGVHLPNSRVESIVVDKDDSLTVIGAVRDDNSHGIIVFSQIELHEKDDGCQSDPPHSTSSWKNNVLHSILTDFFHLTCVTHPLEVPKLTPCCVYTRDASVWSAFLERLKPCLQNGRISGPNVCLQLTDLPNKLNSEEMTNEESRQVIPMFYDKTSSSSTWNAKAYFHHLKTKVFGQVVCYCEVLTSTMDLFNSSNIPREVVCIAGRQTKGKGRREHVWLSPEGCAMFSLQVLVPLNSVLGHRLPFVQHLASLAMVEGILNLPGYKDLNLKLKWPNDVYFGDHTKLGGVIVQSTMMGNTVYCTIGCGLNISNEKPTVCLRDVIGAANPELPMLSREQVIASALNRLEELISVFQESGARHVLPRYYSHWLHGGTLVKLVTADGKLLPATVQGLDESGFLTVRLEGSGKICSVQPDGNSFDMLHNMVIIRKN